MKNHINSRYFWAAIVIGVFLWALFNSFTFGFAVFMGLMLPSWITIYKEYAANNPHHLWFKRKLYGWGWTPVTWQGWLVIAGYIILATWIFRGIDSGSHSVSDTLINFLPRLVILTIALVWLCIKKGEKPHWQWGEKRE
jgi:hypothetical protein